MTPPKRLAFPPLTVGYSEGLDAFGFFFKLIIIFQRKSIHERIIDGIRVIYYSMYSTVVAVSSVSMYGHNF